MGSFKPGFMVASALMCPPVTFMLPSARPLGSMKVTGGHISALAYTPDGKTLIAGGSGTGIKLFDATTKTMRPEWTGPIGRTMNLALSDDGRKLASVHEDGLVRIWDVATGNVLATLEGHRGSVTCVTFTSDGQRIATGAADGTVKLWATGP